MSKAVEEVAVEETVEEVIERPYTLRKLANGDLWKVVGILRKVLPDEMSKTILQYVSGTMTAENAGTLGMINIATEVFKNLDKAQTEVDEWCADLIGVSVDELNNNYEFGTTPMIIMDVFTDAKNVPFFKVLSKFFS